jgi:hypothetical protein
MQNIIILFQSIATLVTTYLFIDLIRLDKFKLTFHNFPIMLILYLLYLGGMMFCISLPIKYMLLGLLLGIMVAFLLGSKKLLSRFLWVILLTFFWAQVLFLAAYILIFSKLKDI